MDNDPALTRLPTIALLIFALAGCSSVNKTAKPLPEVRYRDLGAKPDLPPFLSETILAGVDVTGTAPRVDSGYGLVVNLENTGRNDGIPTPVRDAIARLASITGVNSDLTDGPLGNLPINQLLADPRTAIVRVDALVPPGARAGDRVDVLVSALDSNSTVSLARGALWQTEIHKGRVTPQSPGERVNLSGQARGPLVTNPVYSIRGPAQVKDDPAARASLRTATIPDGGVTDDNRFFVLRLRSPSYRNARTVEARINYYYGRADDPVAAAQDEATVFLRMPPEYRGDWERFVGVTTCLFAVGGDPAYALDKAQLLARAAKEPGRTLPEMTAISYAWEGLGPPAMATLVPLLSDPDPSVAYHAARAAAFNKQPAAVAALVRIAGEPENSHSVAAVETLGKLEPTPDLLGRVRGLVDAPSPGVRVAAYQALDRLGDDKAIFRLRVGEQFLLDIVDGTGDPIVWASRTGTPRVAVIGRRPTLRKPMLLTAFGDRLSIQSSSDAKAPATIFFRPVDRPARQATIAPDLVELLARLGGETRPGELPIDLTYGDVIAILKKLGDDGQIVDERGGPVAVLLQDAVQEAVDQAPIIPGLERGGAVEDAATPDDPNAPLPPPIAPPVLPPVAEPVGAGTLGSPR